MTYLKVSVLDTLHEEVEAMVVAIDGDLGVDAARCQAAQIEHQITNQPE